MLRSPWKLTLMGKCLGINVKSSLMESRVRAMWRIKGSLEFIDVGSSVYLFKFTQSDDYEKALFGGSLVHPGSLLNDFNMEAQF